MSKVTIEYDLDNPDDKMALNRALKSTDMAVVIFNLKYNLKKKVEHMVEKLQDDDPDVKYEAMEIVLEKVWGELENINIDELID